MITAIAVFNNDPSVGIFREHFEMELPIEEFDSVEDREWVREQIKKLYTELNGDFICSYVLFDDENEG